MFTSHYKKLRKSLDSGEVFLAPLNDLSKAFDFPPHELLTAKFRSSRPEVFCKIDVLRNFVKFTGKQLCQSLFALLKKRLWHRSFLVNFAKFLRTTFLTEHLRWLLLKVKCLFMVATPHNFSGGPKNFRPK